jgi:hypothetical protein
VDAGGGARTPERHDAPDFGEREPQPAGLTHERQQPQHVGVVVSVAGWRAPGGRENPARFVQPERLAAEAAARRYLPDEQSVVPHERSIALAPRGKVKRPALRTGLGGPARRLVPFQLFAPRKAPCTSFVDRFSINKLERH